MVKRVRGVAYSMKVSPQNTNRMVCGIVGGETNRTAGVGVIGSIGGCAWCGLLHEGVASEHKLHGAWDWGR
jgi:hypothetical protein